MAHDTLGPALRRIGRGADPRPDADLVAAFVADRCDTAFAELVARHGPVVLGTCRRLLGHAPDADDAFQATFLVLARRAGTIRPPGMVGAWLYGVAVKVATRARANAARRSARDRLAARPEAVVDSMTDPDLRPLIDAELVRLPERLRTVVVLCDLGGKTRSEAARELGWPEGTVATRLAKGRAALADRLRRRGVVVSVAALPALLAPAVTSAAVPAALFDATLTVAGITPAAVALANGVTRIMFVKKLVPAVLVALAGGLVVVAGAAVLHQPTVPIETPMKPTPRPMARIEEPSPWKEVAKLDQVGWLPGSLAYRDGGKMLVVGGSEGHVRAFDTTNWKEAWNVSVAGSFAAVAVSPDGATVAATTDGVRFLDAATGKAGELLEEKDTSPTAVAYLPREDVQGFPQTTVVFGNARGYFIKSWLKWPMVGTISTSTGPKEKEPTDAHAVPLAADPKGRSAIMTGPIHRDTGKNILWAYGCGQPQNNHLMDGHKATVTAAAWSADGKTAVTGDADGTVIVWDADTFKEKSRHGFDRRVVALAITADGKKFAAAIVANDQIEGAGEPAYHERVYVLDADTPTKTPTPLPVKNDKPLGGPFRGRAGLAFAPDGKSLAAGFCNHTHLARSGELIGVVRVWQWVGK